MYSLTTCRHCERRIVNEDGRWVDPEATGDDSVWRETCDAHDTFIADHEPAEAAATEGAQLAVGPWAHNTDRSGPNKDVPVVWENTGNPPSDMENWHSATDDEYAAYVAYWRAKCVVCRD